LSHKSKISEIKIILTKYISEEKKKVKLPPTRKSAEKYINELNPDFSLLTLNECLSLIRAFKLFPPTYYSMLKFS